MNTSRFFLHTLIAAAAMTSTAYAADTLTYSEYANAGLVEGLQLAYDFSSMTANVSNITHAGAFTVANGVGTLSSENTPWTTSLGNTFSGGFTVSFDLLDASLNNWAPLLSLYSNNTTYGDNNSFQVQKNTTGELYMYTSVGGASAFSGTAPDSSNIRLGLLEDLKNHNLTFTYGADAKNGAVLTAYVDGVSKGTMVFTNDVAAMTGFQFGATFGNTRKQTSSTLDNVAFWDGALSNREVFRLSGNALVWNGTAATWTADGAWNMGTDAVVFENGDSVRIGSGTVTIVSGETIVATRVTVDEGATLTSAGSLSATSLDVAGTVTTKKLAVANSSITISGAGVISAETLESSVGGKTLTLGDNTKFSVGSYATSNNNALNFALGVGSVLSFGTTDLQGNGSGSEERSIVGTLADGTISSVVNFTSSFASKYNHNIRFEDVRVNVGDGGICKVKNANVEPGTQKFVNAVIGTLTGEGWTSTNEVPLAFGNTVTIDTAVWDAETNAHSTTNTSGGSITINGVISDISNEVKGTLVKTGAGTLTLTGANTYSGGTTISDGILVAAHTNALAGGKVTVDGELRLGVTEVAVKDLSGTGSVSLASVPQLSSASLTVTSEKDTTFSGKLSGAINLVVKGDASLTLSGQNELNDGSYISIDGGHVKVADCDWGWRGNLGKTLSKDGVRLSNNGILEVTSTQDGDTTNEAGKYRAFSVVSGNGEYRYSGSQNSSIANESDGSHYEKLANRQIGLADGTSLTFDVVKDGVSLSVSKIIASNANQQSVSEAYKETTASLIKTGAGTLILSGDNKYTGGTTISGGILVAESASALGAGDVSIVTGAKLQANVDLSIGGDISLMVTSSDISGSESATGLIVGNSDASLSFAEGKGVYVNLYMLKEMEQVEMTADGIALQLATAGVLSSLDQNSIFLGIEYAFGSVSMPWTEVTDWKIGEWNGETGVLTLVAVPEPSAFGLLAGVGALALVASRRRRNRR